MKSYNIAVGINVQEGNPDDTQHIVNIGGLVITLTSEQLLAALQMGIDEAGNYDMSCNTEMVYQALGGEL